MKRFLFPLALLIVILLGLMNYLIGYEVSFSIFYLIPILMIAYFRGVWEVITIAIISSAAWLSADIVSGNHYSHVLIPLWNMFMRLAVFIIIAVLLTKARKKAVIEKKLAKLDILTGLNNANSFIRQAEIERKRSLRFKRPFAIAYIDIDNFKQLNDFFGHSKGDILLKSLGEVIKNNIRTYDIAARLGGDEFIILFSETNEKQAEEAVNKIKSCIEEILRRHMDSLTLSIGVIIAYNQALCIEGIIKLADDLMYSVKNNSKNGIKYETLN